MTRPGIEPRSPGPLANTLTAGPMYRHITVEYGVSRDYILRTLIDLMKENGFTLENARSRWYPARTITGADYTDDIASLANTTVLVESLLYSPERAAGSIGLHKNAVKTKSMYFNQRDDISTLNGGSLKLVDKFTYLGSSFSSTENDINTWLTKARIVTDRILVLWKSNISDKIKRNFSKQRSCPYYCMDAPFGRWLSV